MEFTQLIAQRYSCKQYSPRQVEPDKLKAILAAGRLAPTAKNLQEQRIYVLQSPEALEKVDALTPCRYGAPTVLAVAWGTGTPCSPTPAGSGTRGRRTPPSWPLT